MANIADIIKYEGDNSTFIWKHPCEDFNTTTQLIVHESQEAIFFLNGQALDLFGPGRHTLETQNIPLLSRILNRITGGDTPFHCEVYFVNKTEQMSIKWGTDSKVQYVEPTYGFPISIGASGEMSLRAEDSRKLLLKLVGTENFLGQQKLIGFFRAFLMTRVKTYIAQTMKANAINIFELDENLTLFSNAIYQQLIPDFADYGVSLERFFVTNVVKPDGDRQYEKFKELHFRQYADIAEAKLRQQTDLIYAQTEAQKVVIDSQAQATKRAQEGYTYQQERGFDVATEVARNEAVGQFTNLGVGLGTMAGVGGAVAGTVGGAMNDALSQAAPANSAAKCMKCGAPLPQNAKFCLECGEKVAPAFPENMIVCPECGSTVAKGKFCLECGHKFITACPNCGKETIPGAKFCLECGQKL
ncbi:MAG: zinc-ribbon domain-containing protein [Ruminococcaceae bacterium]|jgi:membrane protease subunit (stomatin/prohibitin family)|nr:zinc-ribbon domain-containing protein [Oscillospiraceae bacterium]